MLVDRIQAHQQLDSLEKERIENELNYLKAQINPHALFNSINTIYGYIDKDNQIAREMLLQFSELLRYQLYECSAEKVDLEKEIGYIKNYVAFQRLRKGDEMVVNIEVEDIASRLRIAPLLIVVLIENAFKFVSSSCSGENKINIKIFTEHNMLHCSIVNSKEEKQKRGDVNSGGIGLVNLRRRLELLYPQKHTLNVINKHDFYEVSLKIDLI